MGGMRWRAESVGGMAVQVVPASYFLLRSPSGARAAVLQVSGQRGQLANLHEHLSELEVRRGLFPPLRSRRVGMSGTAPHHCAREGGPVAASLSLRTHLPIVSAVLVRASSFHLPPHCLPHLRTEL